MGVLVRYRCPSCKINWEDGEHPLEKLCQPLCVFCSTKHTEKELLNWQMEHFKDIFPAHFPAVIRHFYRYVERSIKNLQEELYETKQQLADYTKNKDSR